MLRIAVIGGGFTGAAFIIHAIHASQSAAGDETALRLQFDLIERSAEIGRGIAYSTRDPLHRINVPSDRMSLFCDDPTHATRWLIAHDLLDPGSTDANGHHYVSREHYGAYVAATLRDTVAAAGDRVRFTHWRASATAIHVAGTVHEVILDTGVSIEADRIALCIGHAAPALPCEISDATLRNPALITNPWAPQAFERIPQHASVLVVGTGLTMADCAVSLLERGHRGPITAISRRGLLAQPQGLFSSEADFLGDAQPPSTVRALLRMLRERIAREMPLRGWQPAVDALRFDLARVWQALPPSEQRRVVRRLLPFWDVHRFRVAPQVHAVLREAIDARRIVVETKGIAGIDDNARDGFVVTLKQRSGAREQRVFDRIVFCTGPARNISANPLVHSLLAAGRARLDGAGIGLDVDSHSQLRERDGGLVAGLFAFGPITRGSFGEMSGAPDIARHIERLLKDEKTSILSVPV
ncbi:FAD/NAD(P)-binding protein [Paraburkholderia xenovorans]